jgi:predicted Zn-dependent peptidase
VSYSFERLPYEHYSLTVSFESKPADVDTLLQATREVIADVKKSGIPASYVEKLSSQRTRDLEEYYRSNGFWLEHLLTKYRMREDLKEILILHELTKRVTSANVQRAARKFLRDEQYVLARLEPGAAAPASDRPAADSNTPPASDAQRAPAGSTPPAHAQERGPTSRAPQSLATPPAN